METTYQKDGDSLKIIEGVISVIPLTELLAERDAINGDKSALDTQYQVQSQNLAERLSRVESLITKAEELQIVVPETPVDPEPSE